MYTFNNLQDYETVEKIKQDCLKDPFGTVERLKNGDDLGIPHLQVIAEVLFNFYFKIFIINSMKDSRDKLVQL